MKNKGFFKNFKSKFKIVVVHPDTFEEKRSFKTSKFAVTVLTVVVLLLVIIGTASVIVFTPIREFIPGYTDIALNRRVYEMKRRTDSIENDMRDKDQYIKNIRRIIFDEDLINDSLEALALINKGVGGVAITKDKKSEKDSLFRKKFESDVMMNPFVTYFFKVNDSIEITSLHSPHEGLIIRHFDFENKQFGVDIAVNSKSLVNAIADGTVVYAGDGNGQNTIIIQHFNDVVSVYENNTSLIRHVGDMVNGGDAIAIVDYMNDRTSFLHFEMWNNGKPLNPEEYISFGAK